MAFDDDAAEAQRWLGTVVEHRYELVRFIATGGTGTVFEGVHVVTGRHVAVKILRPELAKNREAVARFLREARATSRLDHPCIAQVLDAGETEDRRPYLVQELLQGRDLFDAIQHGDLTPEDVRVIGIQLCLGLAAAHEEGIVHRDVKPENVFLARAPDGDTVVKLLDFGLAKSFGHGLAATALTAPGRTVGTPWYMSPEQAVGGTIDHRADIWSAGAVLFHAAVGEPPFDAPQVVALMTKIVRTRAPRMCDRLADAPAALAHAVDRALEPAAKDRWQTAREMAGCLSG